MRQSNHSERMSRSKLHTSWYSGKMREREREKGPGTRHVASDLLPPNRPHFLVSITSE
jgi:hypothetical protein